MPVTSAADRWASKIVIVVQLVTWNAIGIVIIQSGVSTLQQRMLEATSHYAEVRRISLIAFILTISIYIHTYTHIHTHVYTLCP